MRYFRTEDNTGFKYIHSKDDKVIYIENETAEAPQFSLQYGDKLIQIFITNDGYKPERDIAGTPDLFTLSYRSDMNDKGQYILATEAEINIYEDDFFNIDELKTVGETDILIKYFEGAELVWQGFALPDFFQTGITKPRALRIVATDRLGVLKDIANNSVSTTPKAIIEECLLQTGLTLPVEIRNKNSYIETTTINRERIEGVSAYDIIRAFMVQFNSKIVQYKNKWWIVNKKLLEDGFLNQEIIDIDLVYLDGQREIKPTASDVSLYLEYGGSKKYPENWNFEKWTTNKFDNWTNHNGFVQRRTNKEVVNYSVSNDNAYINFGTQELNEYSLHCKNRELDRSFNLIPYIKSDSSLVDFNGDNSNITLKIDFTSVNAMMIKKFLKITPFYLNIVPLISVITGSNTNYFIVEDDGNVKNIGKNSYSFDGIKPIKAYNSHQSDAPLDIAVRSVYEKSISVRLEDLKAEETSVVTIQLVIFTADWWVVTPIPTDFLIHSAEVSFNKDLVTGKGLIFKTKQGGDKFSKVRETETALFSDKINQGVNGYFYNYKYDDTSITNLPKEYLLEMTRQMADMFCSARDFYSIGGKFKVNPLARYRCGSKYFVLVGGQSKRKTASIEIEEIVSNEGLIRTDYIYTYFEDSKDNIKSIGTASGSGGGGGSGGGSGGGMTAAQITMLTNLADWWKLDEENDAIYSEKSVYSLKGVSALGLGDEGGSGGGVIDIVDNLTSNESNKALSARQGMILDNKISNIEVGEGGQVIVDWDAILAKPTTFPPAPHSHVITDVTGLQSALDLKANLTDLGSKEDTFTKKTAFNKNFGTGLNDVARGNHTHAFSELEATPTTLQGYGITDATLVSEFELHKDNTSNPHSVTKAQVGLSNVDDVKQAPKDEFDSFKQLFDSLFEVDEDGNIKALKTFYSVGNISAYGLGDSGSGSGSIDVINNLISTSTNQALSANQGRILNINKADKTEVSALATDKVDKVEGKSLIADSEILRLANVTNQDLTPYETTSNVNTKLNTKVDKVTGKSLISDSEITRLSSVANQDLTPYEKISDVNTKLNNKVDKVANKSLILDSEITRLASVTNQTKASLGLDLVANKNLSNVDNIQQASKVNFDAHTANKLNPHAVTKDQVGLGNVSNVLQASKNEFDANKSTTDVHIANKLNPHSVTAFQVGLGNVTNNLQATKAEFDNFVTLFNQMFEIDGDVIKAKKTLYSVGNISAYGQGTGGTGGAFDMIYNGLDSSVTDVAGSANNDFVLNNKITSLENRTLTTVSGSVEYQEIDII